MCIPDSNPREKQGEEAKTKSTQSIGSTTQTCPFASMTYKTKPTLDELLNDPLVDAELKKAWLESNPY